MSVGGVTQAVHDHLDADGAAREMLARDVLNIRALARWMIEAHDWDASEEAVVSAIRRYDRGPEDQVSFGPAREILAESHVHSRADVSSLMLPRTPEVHHGLSDLFDLIRPEQGDLLRIIETEKAVKVMVTGQNLDRVLDTMGEDRVLNQQDQLAEFRIVGPFEGYQKTPGVLALLATTLAVRQVNLEDSVSGAGEHLLVVNESDALRTYQALRSLCSGRP